MSSSFVIFALYMPHLRGFSDMKIENSVQRVYTSIKSLISIIIKITIIICYTLFVFARQPYEYTTASIVLDTNRVYNIDNDLGVPISLRRA